MPTRTQRPSPAFHPHAAHLHPPGRATRSAAAAVPGASGRATTPRQALPSRSPRHPCSTHGCRRSLTPPSPCGTLCAAGDPAVTRPARLAPLDGRRGRGVWRSRRGGSVGVVGVGPVGVVGAVGMGASVGIDGAGRGGRTSARSERCERSRAPGRGTDRCSRPAGESTRGAPACSGRSRSRSRVLRIAA